jgi:hypothetical protein
MKELENHTYFIGYVISNSFALLLLFLAIVFPRIARIFFCLLFAFASYTNWKIALQSPETYVQTSRVALNIYSQFITGWFSRNVLLVVGFIATAQALIAISVLLKGWIYKTGTAGAIVFLLAIMPLGIASAFPSTLIMAFAMMRLLKGKPDPIWNFHIKKAAGNGVLKRPFTIKKITSHFLSES